MCASKTTTKGVVSGMLRSPRLSDKNVRLTKLVMSGIDYGAILEDIPHMVTVSFVPRLVRPKIESSRNVPMKFMVKNISHS